MKAAPLLALAALILIGWTALAAGVLASLAGHPGVRAHPHHHLPPREQRVSELPGRADAGAPGAHGPS